MSAEQVELLEANEHPYDDLLRKDRLPWIFCAG